MTPRAHRRRRLILPDPEQCRVCASDGRLVKGHVVNSQPRHGYRWRRHQCPICGERWTSWQMVVNPMRLVPRTA